VVFTVALAVVLTDTVALAEALTVMLAATGLVTMANLVEFVTLDTFSVELPMAEAEAPMRAR
jgi:hypothetical protein